MIEIEKKFLLTKIEEQALLQDAEELGQKIVEDSYLDTPDYSLTRRDLWFRERDGAYELKVPLKATGDTPAATNRYHELTDIDAIRQELSLDTTVGFEEALSLADITRFMTCYTNRRSYEKQDFHIDIDSVTYNDSDFTYALAEIEVLINNESQADEAENRIVDFARSFGLTTDQVILGKVGAFLKAERPEHYKILVDAGVLT